MGLQLRKLSSPFSAACPIAATTTRDLAWRALGWGGHPRHGPGGRSGAATVAGWCPLGSIASWPPQPTPMACSFFLSGGAAGHPPRPQEARRTGSPLQRGRRWPLVPLVRPGFGVFIRPVYRAPWPAGSRSKLRCGLDPLLLKPPGGTSCCQCGAGPFSLCQTRGTPQAAVAAWGWQHGLGQQVPPCGRSLQAAVVYSRVAYFCCTCSACCVPPRASDCTASSASHPPPLTCRLLAARCARLMSWPSATGR